MLDFTQLLHVARIAPKQSIASKKRALDEISKLLSTSVGENTTHMDILDALSARERLGSTGLGHGIALPHGRMPELESPAAAVITLDKGIDFDSPDHEPVDILFALLMPKNCNDEHLKILAGLAKLFIQEDLRQQLRNANTSKEVLDIFQNAPTSTPKET